MNTMLLSESQIKKLITMRDVIEIVDRTFVDLGEGKTINPTKLNLNLGDSEPTNLPYKASLNAMPAYIAWQNMAGQKWAGGFGLGRREIGRPFINALIMLVEPNYGDFLAVIDGAWITNMRTGAQTAVILRYLLKEQKDITVGLYGAGVQGRTQTMALTSIFNVKKLYVYDPVPAAAERFKAEMAPLVQGEIIIAKTPKEAAKADAVITVTPATQAFLKGEWLEKGTVYFAMGSYQECDDEAILGASKLICDHVAQCLHRGNLKSLAERGQITADSVYCTVSELAAGLKKVGSVKEEKLLVVPIGMGCLDVAVAGIAYRKAFSLGLGESFSFDN